MDTDQAGRSDMTVEDLDELGARIPFGKLPNQSVLPSWAASMLSILFTDHAQVFASVLSKTLGIEAPVRKRAANGQH